MEAEAHPEFSLSSTKKLLLENEGELRAKAKAAAEERKLRREAAALALKERIMSPRQAYYPKPVIRTEVQNRDSVLNDHDDLDDGDVPIEQDRQSLRNWLKVEKEKQLS
jgi:hypothetical protein